MKNLIPTLEIIERYFRHEKKQHWCVYVAMELEPYYEKLALLEVLAPHQVAETILHDYHGLRSDCDYFVPRLA